MRLSFYIIPTMYHPLPYKKPKPFPGTTFFLFLISALTILQIFFSISVTAQGNLMVMPRRVIFEGPKRYEELNLANTGKDTARYVISLTHLRMNDNGGFELISQPDSGENFADTFVRFFPHSVLLGPNESQTVKIQLTKINQMVPGEYRSHIYFRAIPNQQPLGDNTPSRDSGISMHIVAVFGLSIPLIIRVGPSTTRVAISDPSLQMTTDGTPLLEMTFYRTGNMSIYGDISVDYTPLKGKKVHAGDAKGLAVYTPNQLRHIKINLDKLRGVNYHGGKLHIKYFTPGLRIQPIAEKELVLP